LLNLTKYNNKRNVKLAEKLQRKMLNLTIYNNQKQCKVCNIVAMNAVRLLNLVI